MKMGFDIIGIEPTSKKGKYFRNSVWHWPRLWHFVCVVAGDILTEKDKTSGNFNKGHTISNRKAKIIAQRLEQALTDRESYRLTIEQSAGIKNAGAEAVTQALIIGLNAEEFPKGNRYPFSWENVAMFAEFCKRSGGFQIC
jgi:hypothetical protein